MSVIDDILLLKAEQVAKFFQNELKNEHIAQGHKLTGSFVNSINYEVLSDVNTITILLKYAEYGRYLETGVSAAKIPFGTKTGKKVSQYIEALRSWATLRGFTNPLGAAFAIAKTHKKEGMPSKGSYKFSNNGRRTDFQSFVLKSNKSFLEDFISQDVAQQLTTQLFDLIRNTTI